MKRLLCIETPRIKYEIANLMQSGVVCSSKLGVATPECNPYHIAKRSKYAYCDRAKDVIQAYAGARSQHIVSMTASFMLRVFCSNVNFGPHLISSTRRRYIQTTSSNGESSYLFMVLDQSINSTLLKARSSESGLRR